MNDPHLAALTRGGPLLAGPPARHKFTASIKPSLFLYLFFFCFLLLFL